MNVQIKADLSKESVIIFVFMIIMFLQGCIFSDKKAPQKYLDTETRLTDEAISKSPALQELDKICTNVELPNEFVFVPKGGTDDEKSVYHIHIMPIFLLRKHNKFSRSILAKKVGLRIIYLTVILNSLILPMGNTE